MQMHLKFSLENTVSFNICCKKKYHAVPDAYPCTHLRSIVTAGTPGFMGGGFLGVLTAPSQGLTHPDSSPPDGTEKGSSFAACVGCVVCGVILNRSVLERGWGRGRG